MRRRRCNPRQSAVNDAPALSEPLDDLYLVSHASARLDIREADLVQLAHRWWHGEPLAPDALNEVFAAYMFDRIVPPWLRLFAREVLRCDLEEPESAHRLGLGRLPPPPPEARYGWLVYPFTLALMVAIVTLCIAPAQRQSNAEAGSSAPLSCAGGGPGLAALEGLSYVFAGRRPPACPRPLPTGDPGETEGRGGG